MNFVKINSGSLELPKFAKGGKKKNWKGSNILDRQYFVFGILGKRRSGKSTLVYNLLQKFATRNTIVVFFVNTFMKDQNYAEMREYLDKAGILYHHYDDIVEGTKEFMEIAKLDEKSLKKDIEAPVEDIVKKVKPQPQSVNPNIAIYNSIMNITGDTKVEEDYPEPTPKPKKVKLPQEYIVVYDDVSDSLRETAVKKLIKNSFHYKSKVILASQSHGDFAPDIYQNLDYLALYKNFNQYALQHIYNKIELNIDFNDFEELYHKITDDSFDFLFIDRNNDKFRKNLDTLIRI